MNLYNEHLIPADLVELNDFLNSSEAPPHAMSLPEIDGFLTALVVGPGNVRTLSEDAQNTIWGDSQEVIEEHVDLDQFETVMLARMNTIEEAVIDQNLERHAIFEEKPRGHRNTREWVRGFMDAVALDRDRWHELFLSENEEILQPLVMRASQVKGTNAKNDIEKNPKELFHAVEKIADFWGEDNANADISDVPFDDVIDAEEIEDITPVSPQKFQAPAPVLDKSLLPATISKKTPVYTGIAGLMLGAVLALGGQFLLSKNFDTKTGSQQATLSDNSLADISRLSNLLENQLKASKDVVKNVESEREKLSEDVTRLTEEKALIYNQLTAAESQLSELKNDAKIEPKELVLLNEKLLKVTNSQTTLEQERNKMASQLKTAEIELAKLSETRNESNQLKSSKELLEKNYQEKVALVEKMTQNLDVQESQIEEKDKLLSELTERVNTSETMAKNKQVLVGDLEVALSEIKTDKLTVENALKDERKKQKMLSEKLNTTLASLDSFSNDNKKQSEITNEISTERDDLKTRLLTLQEQLGTDDEKAKQLELNLVQMTKTAEEANLEAEKAEEIMKTLKEKVTLLNRAVGEKDKKLFDLEAKHGLTVSELEKLEVARKDALLKVTSMNASEYELNEKLMKVEAVSVEREVALAKLQVTHEEKLKELTTLQNAQKTATNEQAEGLEQSVAVAKSEALKALESSQLAEKQLQESTEKQTVLMTELSDMQKMVEEKDQALNKIEADHNEKIAELEALKLDTNTKEIEEELTVAKAKTEEISAKLKEQEAAFELKSKEFEATLTELKKEVEASKNAIIAKVDEPVAEVPVTSNQVSDASISKPVRKALKKAAPMLTLFSKKQINDLGMRLTNGESVVSAVTSALKTEPRILVLTLCNQLGNQCS